MRNQSIARRGRAVVRSVVKSLECRRLLCSDHDGEPMPFIVPEMPEGDGSPATELPTWPNGYDYLDGNFR